MAIEEVELKRLMLAGLAGDAAAHREFLAKIAMALRAYLRARLRNAQDDVEDIVQETLIAVHTKRDTYDPTYPVTAWAFAIAKYRMIDHIRRLKRRGVTVDLDDAEPELGVAGGAEAGTAKTDVARLLDKLPQKQQAAIRLVKLEDRSVREAAAETGLSESDIKISIHRGLKTLMKVVAEERDRT